jgi:hypothetical protein
VDGALGSTLTLARFNLEWLTEGKDMVSAARDER